MAFTPSSTVGTYSSYNIPLASSISTRNNVSLIGGTIPDQRVLNMVPTKYTMGNTQGIQLDTRYPIIGNQVGTASDNPRGCYVWEKDSSNTYYFAVFGTKVFTSTTGLVGSWSSVTTLLTSATSPVGFTEYIDATNTKKLVLVDGVEGYIYTSNAAGTKIVDADFPSPHLPFPIFIDGYLVLAKKNTGDIYNSDLNAPQSWTAGNFISSELYPDDLSALVKINNYVLAIGKIGCEYFYDAANSTASPLARYEGASLPFGCPIPTSIAANKNTVVMLSNNNDGSYVLKIIEDFKSKEIPIGFLMNVIEQAVTLSSNPLLPADIRGFFIRQAGELLYVLNLDGAVAGTYPCFVYSFSTNIWTHYSSISPIVGYGSWSCFFSAEGTTTSISTFVQGKHGSTDYFFGYLSGASVNTATDVFGNSNSLGMTIQVVTEPIDLGTYNIKYCNRLGLDISTSNIFSSIHNTILISWTDDDFASIVSGGSLDLSGTVAGSVLPYNTYPFITQLGAFRKRSFIISTGGFYTFRGLILDVNRGQQ